MKWSLKQRIYIIAALALINIVIMKYNESKGQHRGGTWAAAKGGDLVMDTSMLKR